MDETMQFEPRSEHLLADELLLICQAFVELGVKKIRLTGGEPLIHPDFPYLLHKLSAFEQLENIAVTTNGSKIVEHIDEIRSSKISQLNISLDSIRPESFTALTRIGDLADVLAGIDAAVKAGVKRIRLNAVVAKGFNDDQLAELLQFAIERGVHIAFIEQMPMGEMKSLRRSQQYLSNSEVREKLAEQYQLLPMLDKRAQAGPAEYYRLANCTTEVGFISPHSNKFCDSCNRVRLTRKGELVLCLGQDDSIDLRALIRQSAQPLQAVKQAIVAALAQKPEAHDFNVSSDETQVLRFMNVTGG
jgi:cyclic pyranopterin phosphate synthase